MRAFLAFLEANGAGEVSARALGEALASDGAATRTALVALGVVRPGRLATAYPCEGIACDREVRAKESRPGATPRFLAVCTQSPRACETLDLEASELAQDVIALDRLLDAIRRALSIEAPLGRSDASDGRSEGAGAPVHLGEQLHDGAARDVFFARRPGQPALTALLIERRASLRATLILVPTARGVDPKLLARHGAGHVAITALADLVVARGRSIVRTPRLGVLPHVALARAADEPVANDARQRGALARLPRARRWHDVTFYGLGRADRLGVAIDGQRGVLTAGDLGLADARTREPVRAFTLLLRICDGSGVFDTKPWGTTDNGKKVVSELRTALSAAFALAESPIAPYSRTAKSWKVRFVAEVASEAGARVAWSEMDARRRRDE